MILEKKYDLMQKRNDRQNKEIDSLSRKIYDLEIANKEKQDMLDSLKSMRKDWKDSLDAICGNDSSSFTIICYWNFCRVHFQLY